jgi:hypothetical protein
MKATLTRSLIVTPLVFGACLAGEPDPATEAADQPATTCADDGRASWATAALTGIASSPMVIMFLRSQCGHNADQIRDGRRDDPFSVPRGAASEALDEVSNERKLIFQLL